MWKEIFEDEGYMDTLMPINYIMLVIMAGIIGIALAGFTAWHYSLALYGQTHIECLEKTRYVSPIRGARQGGHSGVAAFAHKRLPVYGAQLSTLINNAPAPGQDDAPRLHSSHSAHSADSAAPSHEPQNVPYRAPPRQTWEHIERQRERDRYENYMDEVDSAKLPHAFDLGRKKNLETLFGPTKLLWFLPICNSIGDGWSWEPSPKWIEARDNIRREGEEQLQRERGAGWGRMSEEQQPEIIVQRTYLDAPKHPNQYGELESRAGNAYTPSLASGGRRSAGSNKADRVLGREPGSYVDVERGDDVNMRRLSPSGQYEEDDYDTSSDETERDTRRPSLIEQISGFGANMKFGGPGRLGHGQIKREDVERSRSEERIREDDEQSID